MKLYKLLLLFLCLILGKELQAQNVSFQTNLDEIEISLANGDYSTASKRLSGLSGNLNTLSSTEKMEFWQLTLWHAMATEEYVKFPGAAIFLINDTLPANTATTVADKKIKELLEALPELGQSTKYKMLLWEALMERGAVAYANKALGNSISTINELEKMEWLYRKANSYMLLGYFIKTDSLCNVVIAEARGKEKFNKLFAKSWVLRIESDLARGNISKAAAEAEKVMDELPPLLGGNKRSTELLRLLVVKAKSEAYSNNFSRAQKLVSKAYGYADSKKNIRPGHRLYLELSYLKTLYAYENDDQKSALSYQSKLNKLKKRSFEFDQTAQLFSTHIEVYDYTTSSRNDLAVDLLSKGFYKSLLMPLRAGNDVTERAYHGLFRTAVDFDSLNLAERILLAKAKAFNNPNTLGNCPRSNAATLMLSHFRLKTGAPLAPIRALFQQYWAEISKQYSPRYQYYKDWLNAYADVQQASDKFGLALKYAQAADSLILLKEGVKSVAFGAQQIFISQLFMDEGDFLNAGIYIKKGQEALRKGGFKRSIEYVNALRASARLNTMLSNYDDAEDDIDEAIKIKSVLVGQNELSGNSAFDDLALLYFLQGRFSQANNYLDVIIFERTNRFGRTWQIIQPLLIKAQIAVASGDFPTADNHVSNALSIAKKSYTDTSIIVMNCERTRAQVFLQIGDFERATKAFQKSYNQYVRILGPKHPETLLCEMQLDLARYLLYQNKEKSYLEFTDLSINIKEIFGADHPQYASVLENIASVCLAMNKLDQASTLLDQAGKIYINRLGKRSTKYADVLLQQADICREQGKLEEAKAKYEKCQSSYRSAFSKTHPRYVLCLARLSRIAAANNNISEATESMEIAVNNYLDYIRAHFPFLSEKEKALYWAQMRPDFELYRYLMVRNSGKDPLAANKLYADALGTKGLLMMNNRQLRNRIMSSSDPSIRQGFSNWIAAREELTAMQARGESEIAVLAKEQDIEAAEKIMASKSETFAKYRKDRGLTYDNILSVLKTGEAAVEMLRIEVHEKGIADTTFYVALVMKNGDKQASIVTFPKGNFMENNGLSLYRNSIKYNLPDAKSYNRYYAPIDKAIGKTKKVYFSPDGVYHLINLEGLTKEDKTYVGDDVQLVLLNSTREMLKDKGTLNRESLNAMLIGNPSFYKIAETKRTIDDLPGAALEVKALDSLFKVSKIKTTLLTENQATENSLRTVKSPTLLHLATHGYFADDDDEAVAKASSLSAINAYQAMTNSLMRSGLLLADAGEVLKDSSISNPNFADGVLTAYEAQVLNLETTKLVVLSACETGTGKVQAGEGVFGMQRAMTAAGAQVVVMSLFKANDAVTQKLMQMFYQNWIRTGEIRESFVQARNTIRKSYPEPSAWAGFIMVGQ